jgi:hypothetical protein
MHGALIEARDVLKGVAEELHGGNKWTDDELLKRYTLEHRGNPVSMARFVMSSAPKGTDPMKAMRDYESRMEEMMKTRGFK